MLSRQRRDVPPVTVPGILPGHAVSPPDRVPLRVLQARGNGVAYTLGQAARATGKAKPTIARAIQTPINRAAREDRAAPKTVETSFQGPTQALQSICRRVCIDRPT